MKKFIIVVEIILLLLILAKVTSVFGLLKRTDMSSDTSLTTTQAMAQQPADTKAAAVSTAVPAPEAKSTVALKEKDTLDENLIKQRDLAAALLAKKIELDNRENALRAEEQRLLALRKEITEKITLLKGHEEKLTAMLDANQNTDIKRYKEMAKVYEAAPPAKAGAMLEKLDIKTAAGITMNMKKDKAGAVWGFISSQKAVEITKEITRSGKQLQE
jgi:flagellar motility protein MotE (MotC chaperone)